ncbi:MAG: tRNA lysidine(34) synthetase TilS [Myxococcales bacterium]|nr:tRNA lysidine(34) synthetase TilS [Myxococcales bacterium]
MALAWAAATTFGDRARVVHVDHGLHPDSAGWARRVVAAWTPTVGVLVIPVDVPSRGNLEASAREARYAALDALARESRGVVLTAHTADDQAETLLMRLGQAAGLQGLRGVLPRRGLIHRPWLGVPRSAVRLLAQTQGLDVIHDPANDDQAFDRVRVRRALAVLTDALGGDWVRHAAQSARHLQESHAALEELAAPLQSAWRRAIGWWELDLGLLSTLSDAQRRLVVQWGLSRAGASRRGGQAVPRVLELIDGPPGTVGNLAHGWVARRGERSLLLERRWEAPAPEPLRPPFCVDWGPGRLSGTLAPGGGVAVGWPAGEVHVRGPIGGDRAVRVGVGSKPLGRALRDAGVPRGVRPAWPVLVGSGGPFWAPILGPLSPPQVPVRTVWVRWADRP